MNKAKTLIVVAHPDLAASTINKRWVDELEKHPDRFTVHQLYQRYPDGKIDVPSEQRLVDAHQHLVLQFPVYWFNCPPLLKQWFDDVLTYGWAYGSKGNSLKNKKQALPYRWAHLLPIIRKAAMWALPWRRHCVLLS